MNNLEQETNKALDDLEVFFNQDRIRIQSLFKETRDSEQFKRVVSLGKKALPYIYKRFKDEGIVYDSLIFPPLVADIVGDDFPTPPKEIQGRVKEIQNYTLKWLEDNGYAESPKRRD